MDAEEAVLTTQVGCPRGKSAAQNSRSLIVRIALSSVAAVACLNMVNAVAQTSSARPKRYVAVQAGQVHRGEFNVFLSALGSATAAQ
ncbi:MAG TPA: hypothetical protein VFW00_10090, partial [Rhodocyclaceae bacterium]|nr:hypothetical protein [Rhodocyclaceae bacterium]